MPPVKSSESKTNKTLKNSLVKKKKRFFLSSLPVTNKSEKNLPTPKNELKNGIKSVKSNAARLPMKPEEASSNWKNLSVAIKPVHTIGRLKYLEKRKKEKEEAERKMLPNIVDSSQPKEEEMTKEPEVWFDGVDPILLESTDTTLASEVNKDTDHHSKELTKIMALDCEMVGVGADGVESALARVSIVNQHGHCVYDKFVDPGEKVTDYRTQYSGIRPHNLKDACELGTVCHEVSDILRGRILVGHSLKNDLDVLLIKHPKSQIRDTSKFKVFKALVNGATPSLKRLTQHFLGVEIQGGEHSSVQDAQAALRLYMMFRQRWETELDKRRTQKTKKLVKQKQKHSKAVVKKNNVKKTKVVNGEK